jgi:transcription initiation factor TFIIIB Brf1 subunit/transcription initiation factor TFIIB
MSRKHGKSFDIKSMFAQFEQAEPTPKVSPEKEDSRKFSEMENFKCPYCQESTLTVDDGIFVCTSCGKENGTVISEKQEWRSFTDSHDNKDASRCGMPSNPLLPHSSLGTVAQGNVRYGFSRLQIQNAMPSHERSRLDAIKWIKNSAQKLSISGVLADMACYLYVKLTENVKLKRGPKALVAMFVLKNYQKLMKLVLKSLMKVVSSLQNYLFIKQTVLFLIKNGETN